MKITYDGLTPVWHRMLYSCTHTAPVGVKGITKLIFLIRPVVVWNSACYSQFVIQHLLIISFKL